MSYHAVIEYIRAGRACGVSDEAIGRRLRDAGWLDVDVADAFALYSKLHAQSSERRVEVCPPDEAPMPRAADRLMSRHTPHLSAARFTMWFVFLMVAFYAGYAVMR